MEDRSHIITQLILKDMAGKLSGPEKKKLQEWIAESEKNKALYNTLKNDDTLLGELTFYDNILTGNLKPENMCIDQFFVLQQDKRKVISLFGFRFQLSPIAAFIIGLLGLGLLLMYLIPKASKDQINVTQVISPKDSLYEKSPPRLHTGRMKKDASTKTQRIFAPELKLVTTTRGHQDSVVLPDGSRVWLNGASSLRYPIKFNNKERRVEVKGEAYFEIKQAVTKKEKKLPFYVSITTLNGAGTVVEVVGTHFNITAYENMPLIETTVQEGIIKVSNKDTSGYVQKGQRAQWSSQGSIKINAENNPESAMKWKDKLLDCKNMPIMEVFERLKRCYDIEIIFTSEFRSTCYINGTIHTSASITDVLKILAHQCKFKHTVNGNNITISPN